LQKSLFTPKLSTLDYLPALDIWVAVFIALPPKCVTVSVAS